MVVSAAKTDVFDAAAPRWWAFMGPTTLGAVRKVARCDFSDSHLEAAGPGADRLEPGAALSRGIVTEFEFSVRA